MSHQNIFFHMSLLESFCQSKEQLYTCRPKWIHGSLGSCCPILMCLCWWMAQVSYGLNLSSRHHSVDLSIPPHIVLVPGDNRPPAGLTFITCYTHPYEYATQCYPVAYRTALGHWGWIKTMVAYQEKHPQHWEPIKITHHIHILDQLRMFCVHLQRFLLPKLLDKKKKNSP